MSRKTLLVTGGAGFIGSALIRYLIEETEHHVINVDKLTYAGNLDSLANISDHSRYCFEQIDICDAAELRRVFESYRPNAVFHLAAESHVDRSIDAPSPFIETNIVGTYQLLETTRQYLNSLSSEQKNLFRLIHVSTDEVFGDLEETAPKFSESTPYNPRSPYSASKASSDHLVRAWQSTYQLPIIVTNCSNNYGPFQFPEKLIPHTILNALAGKPIPIYGNGQQIRDWLFVSDHVKALYQVLMQGKVSETYLIGGNSEKRNIDVVRSICDCLDELLPSKNTEFKHYRQLIKYVTDRPGHDYRYAINASKIKQQLNWEPTESFESGLKKTVDWYLNHTDWWQRILSGDYRLARKGKLKQ